MTALAFRTLMLACIFSVVLTGCSVHKQYRNENGQPRMIGVTQTVSVETPQPKVILQLTATGELEGRFEEPPFCQVSEKWETPAFQIEQRSLSAFDTALMWTGYGIAALVGGFVGTGVANGGDPVTGAKLFAAFGVPFAAVGVAETVRATDRTSPLPATSTTVERGVMRCAVDAEGLPVRFRRGAEERSVLLSTQFRPLEHPGEGFRFVLVSESQAMTVRSSVPLQVTSDGLRAVLDGPVVRKAVEQAPKADPASQPAPVAQEAEVEKKPAAAPEPAPPLIAANAMVEKPVEAVQLKAEPAKVEPKLESPQPLAAAVAEKRPQVAVVKEPAAPCTVRITEYGKLPSAFFEQPVRTYRLKEGDWLSIVAKRLWGEVHEYRQLHLLNVARVKNADVVFAGEEIVVPVSPKAWVEWQRGAEACGEQ